MNTKVAFFMPSFAGGGAEKVVVTLANGFARQGRPVDLVVANPAGILRDQVDKSVRVIDLHAGGVIASTPGLVRYLRTEKPRALLASQTHANLVAAVAARVSGFKGRVTVREGTNRSALSASDRNFRERVMSLLERWLYRQVDAVIAVSRGVAEDISYTTGIPVSSIRVVYNPVDIMAVHSLKDETPSHPWLQDSSIPVILAAGRLVPAKDFPVLLRAFSILYKSNPARLMILGEGKEREKLESIARKLGISDCFSMPGFAPNPYAFMSRSKVFVLSSHREGFPNVLVEAMACGTPVVATRCPSGPAEILQNGQYGALVPVGDHEALARAVLETMAHPLNSAILEQRAVDFSLEKILQQYTQIMCPSL